jgi:hypothetical protein
MVETVEGIETVETAESPVFRRFFVHVDEKTELRGKGLGIIPPSPPLPYLTDFPSFAFRASESVAGDRRSGLVSQIMYVQMY